MIVGDEKSAGGFHPRFYSTFVPCVLHLNALRIKSE
jgi:hypothetical protein